MPAKLIIQSGIAAGASHWIQRPVIRIGSDPAADVCLPTASVPPHALTLEFRNGVYRVFNRCRTEISIGTHRVSPGQAADWQDTDVLKLNDEVELALELDEDPRPRPVRTVPDVVQEAENRSEQEPVALAPPPAEAPANRSSSQTIVQLAVIAVCLFGCVALLVREQNKRHRTKRNPPRFGTVVRDALASKTTSPQLVRRLQHAESAFIRGDQKAARQRFGRLRDDLAPHQQQYARDGRNPELAIIEFT